MTLDEIKEVLRVLAPNSYAAMQEARARLEQAAARLEKRQ